MDTKFRGTPLLLQAQLSNAALPISRSFLSAPAPRATCPVRLAGGSIASTATALCASDVDLQNSRLAACVEAAGDMGLAGTSSPAAASPRGPWRVADASTDGQHSVFGWQTQYKGVAQYAAAGVMPFAYRQADGELYVLLSLQRTRRRVKQAEEEAEAAAPAAGPARQTLAYTFLGGKVEVGDGGDARVTAAREAHEETHRLLHTEQVREALCGRPHGRMVADEAHMPSGSGSSISPGSSSSGTTVASDARSAGAGSGGPDLPAPYMYFPSGRYTLFALHLPDAWRLPQACQAKLQAGETHPEADKVLGLEWVSLRQLGSIKQGNAQYVTLGRGLPGSSRNGVPSRAAPKNASNGLAQPATATSTTAAPEAASAPERPSAATSDSAGTATVTGGSATSSPASGVAPSGPASGVAASGPASGSGSGSGSSGAGGGQGEAGADCSARAHHFLADILRNKRMSVGVHGWLLCMRRHMRQWHGFQGARPDETAEEEEALAKAARLALGLADVDDDRFVDDGGADSDGEGQEAASAAPGGLEQLFSELPSSLQVSSQGADTRAAEKPRQRAEAEEASRVRVHQHIVERDVQRTALAKATEAARAALPMRRPPPPLLPLPVVVPPASVLASRLPMPMPRMPLPVPPPPAALPRPSPSLVSAAAPPASAARAGAAASTSTSTSTRTSTSAQSPSYTVWCMDGSPDSHTGQPPPAETRLRLQPVANARGPSGRPDTGGQGPWQASARSPHQSGHAQEAAISTSTSTSAQAPLVTVWRMDGTPDSRVGEPPPAETRLRLQPAANARDASFRPGTGGKGQEQASVSSPHQSGHAQGSPAVVASTQGGGETEEVVVWRMDGGVQWGTSGGAHGASAATVLKQRSGFGDAGAMGAAGSKPARKVADLRAAGRREARE